MRLESTSELTLVESEVASLHSLKLGAADNLAYLGLQSHSKDCAQCVLLAEDRNLKVKKAQRKRLLRAKNCSLHWWLPDRKLDIRKW